MAFGYKPFSFGAHTGVARINVKDTRSGLILELDLSHYLRAVQPKYQLSY
jgi:hypothetical protein